MLQKGYLLRGIFKSVARSVMPSLKEIGRSAVTTGLEVLQDVAKDENIKTAAKKCLKENSLAFLDDTETSNIKNMKRKHQSGELDDTIFSKLIKRKKLKMEKPVHKILMIAVLLF